MSSNVCTSGRWGPVATPGFFCANDDLPPGLQSPCSVPGAVLGSPESPPNCDPVLGPIGTACDESAGRCDFNFLWKPTFSGDSSITCSYPITCLPIASSDCEGGTWGPIATEGAIGCDNEGPPESYTKCSNPYAVVSKIGGDPHVKRFHASRRESFHGACDLVFLTDATFGEGLELHVRTAAREDRGYSYVQAAALRIGNDIMELDNKDHLYFNGKAVSYKDLPLSFGGESGKQYMINLPVPFDKKSKDADMSKYTRSKIYHIDLGGSYIDFKTGLTLMSVTVGAVGHDFMHSHGLAGHRASGSKRSRDGKHIDDMHSHGMEWQVHPDHDTVLFATASGPQLPHAKCEMPSIDINDARRHLRYSRHLVEQAESVCTQEHPNDLDLCIQDVLLTGGTDVLESW